MKRVLTVGTLSRPTLVGRKERFERLTDGWLNHFACVMIKGPLELEVAVTVVGALLRKDVRWSVPFRSSRLGTILKQ